MSRRVCDVEDCERRSESRGWCNTHYERWRRTGSPTGSTRKVVTGCNVQGCDGDHEARGWCRLHYKRWCKTGDPLNSGREKVILPEQCIIDDCVKPPCNGRGWCTGHYRRYLCYGDPLVTRQPARQSGRRLMANGYISVRVTSGNWQYEHRTVWQDAHGPIPNGYHVHHRNEDRTDNRLENLELRLGADHNREHTTERHRNGSLNNRGSNSVRWRDLDDEEIVRRRDAGESFYSIARDLGVASNTVSTHYKRAQEEVMAL